MTRLGSLTCRQFWSCIFIIVLCIRRGSRACTLVHWFNCWQHWVQIRESSLTHTHRWFRTSPVSCDKEEALTLWSKIKLEHGMTHINHLHFLFLANQHTHDYRSTCWTVAGNVPPHPVQRPTKMKLGEWKKRLGLECPAKKLPTCFSTPFSLRPWLQWIASNKGRNGYTEIVSTPKSIATMIFIISGSGCGQN